MAETYIDSLKRKFQFSMTQKYDSMISQMSSGGANDKRPQKMQSKKLNYEYDEILKDMTDDFIGLDIDGRKKI